MLEIGLFPNIRTFSMLIDMFCKEGWVNEAKAMLELMIERGESPDIITYSSLLDGYCLRGQMHEASK